MAIATKEQILKVLRSFNPWWTTGSVHPDFTKKYRRFAYHEAMKRLDEREHEIITLRFFEGKTQMEVADIIGISQAQVSRLEKNALRVMKNYLTV